MEAESGMWMWNVIAGLLGVATSGLAALVIWQLVDRARLRRRFAGIVDLDREIARRRLAFELELSTRQRDLDGMLRKTTELRQDHAAAAIVHDRLRAELAVLEDTADTLAIGLYPPSFPPGAPEDHKRRLHEVRAHQRALVRDDQALAYGATWTLGHSRIEDARMQRQYARLLLRAFNGECDAAIARVRWDNAPRMAERLTQAFSAINRLGAVLQIELTAAYRDCKLDELRLEHALDQQRRAEPGTRRDPLAAPAAPARLDDGAGPRAVELTARGIARGSVQVLLSSHVPRLPAGTAIVATSVHPPGLAATSVHPPGLAARIGALAKPRP
jgi:hypothetical protein